MDSPLYYIIIGMVMGIMLIAPVVFIMSLRSEFTEIKWHDAVMEDPTEYIEENPILGKCIRVLVRYNNGKVCETHWIFRDKDNPGYPDIPYSCFVTHFAYIKEVERTIYIRKHDAVQD